MHQDRRRGPHGLTLIEIIVVTTTMSILMGAVAVYAVGQHVDAQNQS
jgi:prepilin-type N-terminal cleavage/methylation domain-containing protein